jgi:hypothetical protein
MKRGTLLDTQHFLGDKEFALFGHLDAMEIPAELILDLPPVSHLQHRWGKWVRPGRLDLWILVSQRAYARGLFPITLVIKGEAPDKSLDKILNKIRIRFYRHPTWRKPQRPND